MEHAPGCECRQRFFDQRASCLLAFSVPGPAGYKKDTIPFFRNCIRAYPYDALRQKCVVGLVAADPGAAYDTLMALEKESDTRDIALRLMGLLANQTGLTKDKKTALVDALLARGRVRLERR